MNLLESLKEVDRREFLGSVSTEYGIRRKTLQEYLRDFQDYGIIEIVDDKIRWIGKQEEGEEPED